MRTTIIKLRVIGLILLCFTLVYEYFKIKQIVDTSVSYIESIPGFTDLISLKEESNRFSYLILEDVGKLGELLVFQAVVITILMALGMVLKRNQKSSIANVK